MTYFIRKRGDIDLPMLCACYAGLLGARDVAAYERVIQGLWGDTAIVALSVRSVFDALLASIDWPPGSRVLMSAGTIPHMADLVRHHGFEVVAVDLDPSTMSVTALEVAAMITPTTRAIVVAPLFGARHDLTELAELATERGLLLIEDCAQCYPGAPPEPGRADVEMFSFGAIKTTTCFGGAVARVRSTGLRAAMAAVLGAHPPQSRLEFARRVVKYTAIILTSGPRTFAAVRHVLGVFWGDYDRALRMLSRGFPDGQLIERIRRRPSAPLLFLMARRFSRSDRATVDARTRAADALSAGLPSGVSHVGAAAPEHTHWLFPVACSDPAALIAQARQAGFDATAGASTLVSISPDAARATATLNAVVYLPIYPQMSPADIARLAASIPPHTTR